MDRGKAVTISAALLKIPTENMPKTEYQLWLCHAQGHMHFIKQGFVLRFNICWLPIFQAHLTSLGGFPNGNLILSFKLCRILTNTFLIMKT